MTIKLTYRRTSRLSMRIDKQGDVRVSVPIGTPRDEVQRFIEKNRDWIAKAQTMRREQQQKRDAFYGRLPLDTRQQRTEAVARLTAIIRPLMDKYTTLMGVSPKAVGFGSTTSRWGSCQPRTGRIRFSLYLLLLPQLCIEHVVVHELAHLIEPNHSARFYAVMDRFFPRWREARQASIDATT